VDPRTQQIRLRAYRLPRVPRPHVPQVSLNEHKRYVLFPVDNNSNHPIKKRVFASWCAPTTTSRPRGYVVLG
jgi:hypothetical protein